jgi:hypothetical protein
LKNYDLKIYINAMHAEWNLKNHTKICKVMFLDQKSVSALPVPVPRNKPAPVQPLFQSPRSKAKPFVPTVTSVSKANFNFGAKASSTPAVKEFVPTVTSTAAADFNFRSRKSPRLSGSVYSH